MFFSVLVYSCMLFLFPRFLILKTKSSLYSIWEASASMYPKVKVREQIEEADQYIYERSSLQSLKAFEWLSLDHFSSSDECPRSVVRIPGSYFPKPPTCSFQAPKEETNQANRTVVGENRKIVRAASAPRPRAVLSSPDNDGFVGSKTQTRGELLSALKNHNSCQNRHIKCKVLPTSEGAEIAPPQWRHKEPHKSKNNIRAKGRTALAGSRVDREIGKEQSQNLSGDKTFMKQNLCT